MEQSNVQIRPPEREDLPFIQALWADPETMEPVGGPIHLTDEQMRRWFEWMVNPGNPANHYCLIINPEGWPVGEVSFHRLNREQMQAELNIKVAHTERRKGHAKEALRQLLDYFFHEFGGRVMLDDVALDNKAGQQALLRFGFEHDPQETAVFRLRMTRERYAALYSKADNPGETTVARA